MSSLSPNPTFWNLSQRMRGKYLATESCFLKQLRCKELLGLVMLVKDDMDVQVIKELSDDNQLAAIWVKIGVRGRRPMILGGVYWEHRFIYQDQPNSSRTDQM